MPAARRLAPALLCVALMLAPSHLASTASAEVPPEKGPVLVRAARMLDPGSGPDSSRTWEPGAVLARGGMIEAIGEAALDQAPDGAEVIDLKGLTLLPGLIDAHTHLTYGYEESFSPTETFRFGSSSGSAVAARALIGAANARKTLEAGFTTVRDLGAWGFAAVTLDRVIEAGPCRKSYRRSSGSGSSGRSRGTRTECSGPGHPPARPGRGRAADRIPVTWQRPSPR